MNESIDEAWNPWLRGWRERAPLGQVRSWLLLFSGRTGAGQTVKSVGPGQRRAGSRDSLTPLSAVDVDHVDYRAAFLVAGPDALCVDYAKAPGLTFAALTRVDEELISTNAVRD
jgi:hypothetical protein